MNKIAKTLGIGRYVLAGGVLVSMLSAAAGAQELSGDALIDALKGGGYVIVMRHASAAVPEPRGGRGFGFGGGRGGGRGGARGGPPAADPEPVLTEEGMGMVTGMKYAFRTFEIPVGDVLTSPTERTQQQARIFGFGDVSVVDELGTEDMRADAGRSAWLAAKAGEPPRAGTNTVIITHAPNIIGAFDGVSSIEPGEALIIRPDGGKATIVARVPIAEWSKLAVS